MPLKVRFRHASSQRVLDLPDRDKARPLIIGRGGDVDLRLPFDPVAPQHAALYLKDGEWVIQSMSGVVTVGGKPLKGPAKLRTGDVIVLGADASAPTLEIEPKAQAPAPAGVPATNSAGIPRPRPAPAPAPARARPAGPPPLAEMDSSEIPAGPESDATPDEGDTVEWDPQIIPEPTSYYVPKPKTPIAAILIAVILGGGLMAGVGILAYRKTHRPPVVIVVQPSPKPGATAAGGTHRPLFDLDADRQNAASAQAATSGTASSDANQPSLPASTDATDHSKPTNGAKTADNAVRTPSSDETPPDPNDVEWAEIRSAHFNIRHQGVAILKYDEYRLDHPGKFTHLLDQYTDEGVNWLYWQRVAQLWSREDELTAQLRQKTRDVQNQPAGDFHDQLVKEKGDLQTKLNQTKQLLTDEMGYHGDLPPDLESPRQLKQLEASRDPAKFAAFSKRVLRYVRNNHGGVWWDGE